MTPEPVRMTIITVVRNGMPFIRDAVSSVLAQKDARVEYILIDGKSTDGTLPFLETIKHEFDWLESRSDGGIYQALNYAISKATGDYIGIVHGDDTLASGAIAAVRNAAIKENFPDIIYGQCQFVTRETPFKKLKCFIGNHRLLEDRMWIPHTATFVRADVCKADPFDVRFNIAADYNFFLRAYRSGKRFLACQEVLTYMRVGGASDRKFLSGFIQSFKIQRDAGLGELKPAMNLVRSTGLASASRLLSFFK